MQSDIALEKWLEANDEKLEPFGRITVSHYTMDLNWGIKHSNLARQMYDATLLSMYLELYKIDTGHYPESLEELVPHYIDSITTSETGLYEYQEIDHYYALGFANRKTISKKEFPRPNEVGLAP